MERGEPTWLAVALIVAALPKDKEMFAKLATKWITLANDLEAIEAQLKTKRQTPPEGIP